MRRGLLQAAMLLGLAPAVALAATDPAADSRTAAPRVLHGRAADALSACAARLDREIDVGYRHIAERCPGLARTLEQDGLEPWLPRTWQDADNELSAGGLEELRVLAGRELARGPQRGVPRVSALSSVLPALVSSSGQRGAWERLHRWLRAIVARPPEPEGGAGWVPLVRRIGVSDAVLGMLSYAAFAAVMTLALLMLARELRLAGLLRRVRSTAHGRASPGAGPAPPSLDALELAPLRERPALLLELILEQLRRRTRIGGTRTLTTRELMACVRLAEPQDGRLCALARTAEQVRYGPSLPPEEELSHRVEDARQLLDELTQPADVGGRLAAP